MKRKIKIQRISSWSIGITVVLALIFFFIFYEGNKEFHVLKTTTDQYITCENAAKQLQDGSDYLTEQVRLYVATGQQTYMDLYFEEANVTMRRDHALETLQESFGGTDTFDALQKAMDCSRNLMDTEYYAMRLMAESLGTDASLLPDELQSVVLSDEDLALSAEKKQTQALDLVCNDAYQEARNEITSDVSDCMQKLITKTQNRQGRATTIFSDMYLKLEISLAVLVVLMLAICLMMRRLVVVPLLSYNKSILRGEIFPVIGAEELQNLAATYNTVCLENQETQKFIRHQAEHDALTGLFNRGAYEKLLHIHETGDSPFALVLVDVDIFKSVNDTYGHATGDAILKKISNQLRTAFRSIDYVCRIGGDEFAIIMVQMTSDLSYTISNKITAVNESLTHPDDGLPAVSLSVGVAFSDRDNPGDSIFKDADKALYKTKENGKCGCTFY
mgnify:FL=1